MKCSAFPFTIVNSVRWWISSDGNNPIGNGVEGNDNSGVQQKIGFTSGWLLTEAFVCPSAAQHVKWLGFPQRQSKEDLFLSLHASVQHQLLWQNSTEYTMLVIVSMLGSCCCVFDIFLCSPSCFCSFLLYLDHSYSFVTMLWFLFLANCSLPPE